MSDASADEQLRQQQQQTVEIMLEAEVYGALCRRGRRRLRDIQSSCQAALKLDRFRGVLQVTGSQKSITEVMRQLESLSGPCLRVIAAVWAELMRTRKLGDLDQAAVAKIQHESGCRIHIDRNAQDVRLFGRQDKIVVAQRLLEELESMCGEEVVQMQSPRSLDAEVLQTFAQDFGVALQVEDKHIAIRGIAGAVAEATKELRKYDAVEAQLDVGKHSEAAHLAISEAMSKLQGNGDADFDSGTLPPHVNSKPAAEKVMQGTVNAKIPASRPKSSMSQQQAHHVQDTDGQWAMGLAQPVARLGSGACGACPTCGDASNFCIHCGRPVRKIAQGPLPGCTTCGAVNFCVYCGQPTEKMQLMAPPMGNTGALQQPYCDGAGYVYDPDVFYADRMPMMQMMPVQFVGSPGSPGKVPEGCIPVHMPSRQGFPVLASTFNNGFQMASSMISSQASGIPSCMVPVAFGSFD